MSNVAGVAVVTGGGSGIGRAIAKSLAGAGSTVAVLDIQEDGAQETVEQITSAGGEAKAFVVDVRDIDAIYQTRDAVDANLGVARVVVNNAGWEEIHPFMDTSVDFWRKILEINLLGQIAISHAFLENMITADNGGRVINISSDAGRVGSSGEAVYAGAKGGVIGFSKSLAREMVRYGITVNCVCPGPTDTPLLRQAPKKLTDALARSIPARRLAQPEDIAHAVLAFADDNASYTTGQTLSVSGGLTMAG